MTDDIFLQGSHQLLDIDGLVDQFVGERQQQPARLGEFKRVPAALKELNAQCFFQRFDVMADRWLREMKLPRRFGKTETLGRVNKCLQTHQIYHRNNPCPFRPCRTLPG